MDSQPALPSAVLLSHGRHTGPSGAVKTEAIEWWAWRFLNTPGQTTITRPLWGFAVLFAAAGAWLYYRSRRPLPGYCLCGYDLAGITHDAPCPECGRTRTSRPKAS